MIMPVKNPFKEMPSETKNNIGSGFLLLMNVTMLAILSHGAIYPESGNAGGATDAELELLEESAGTTGQWPDRRAGDFTFVNMDKGVICNAVDHLSACAPEKGKTGYAEACTKVDPADDTKRVVDITLVYEELQKKGSPDAVRLRKSYRMVNDYLWARYGIGPLSIGATYFGLFLFLWFVGKTSKLKEGTNARKYADATQQFFELLWFAIQAAILHALDLSSHTERNLSETNGYEDLALGLKGALISSGCIDREDCALKGGTDPDTGDCRDYGHVLPGVLVFSGLGVTFFLLYQIFSRERINALGMVESAKGRYDAYQKVRRSAREAQRAVGPQQI